MRSSRQGPRSRKRAATACRRRCGRLPDDMRVSRKDDAATHEVRSKLKSGAATADGAAHAGPRSPPRSSASRPARRGSARSRWRRWCRSPRCRACPPRPTTPSSSWSSAHDSMPGPGPAAFGSTPRSAPGSLSRGVLISPGLRGSSGSLIGGRHHLEALPLGTVHLEACKMTCLRSSRLRSWQFTR
jgi:hypothetical protein